MNHAGQVKIVGDKLHLSSGCPPDKLSSLAYFTALHVNLQRAYKYITSETLRHGNRKYIIMSHIMQF